MTCLNIFCTTSQNTGVIAIKHPLSEIASRLVVMAVVNDVIKSGSDIEGEWILGK